MSLARNKYRNMVEAEKCIEYYTGIPAVQQNAIKLSIMVQYARDTCLHLPTDDQYNRFRAQWLAWCYRADCEYLATIQTHGNDILHVAGELLVGYSNIRKHYNRHHRRLLYSFEPAKHINKS